MRGQVKPILEETCPKTVPVPFKKTVPVLFKMVQNPGGYNGIRIE